MMSREGRHRLVGVAGVPGSGRSSPRLPDSLKGVGAARSCSGTTDT